MNMSNVIVGLALATLFHLCSSATSTSPVPEIMGMSNTNVTNHLSEPKSIVDYIPEIAEKFSSARSFAEKTGLTSDQTYYLTIFLGVNLVFIIGFLSWFASPQFRICSWFNNCDSTVGQYPAPIANNLQDPQVLQYDRRFHKRSIQYIGPLLKTLSEALENYESDSVDKNKKE